MFEALAIRFLWLLYALSPKKKPGRCPPVCSEGHSYKWPCRARSYKNQDSDFGLGLSGWFFGFDIKKSGYPVEPEDIKAGQFLHEAYDSYRKDQAKSESKVIFSELWNHSIDEANLKTGEFIKRDPK